MLICAALNTTRTTTTMKMASASTVFLLLLFCPVVAPTDSQRQCDRYVAAGRDFVVPLNSKQKDRMILRWRWDETIVFSRTDGRVESGKRDDVDESGSLKLKNVTMNQSGIYKPEVYNKDRMAEKNLKSIKLCVIASVSKPSVTITCEGSKTVTFTCTLDPKDRPLKKTLTIVWLQNSEVVSKKNDWSLRLDAKSVAEDKFTCNVSNMASYGMSEPSTQTCFYTYLFPDDIHGISIWVFIGCGGGLVLLLIVIVIICCIRARRMKRMQLKGKKEQNGVPHDEDELRLRWTDTGHHHHHQPGGHRHHHHHHQHSHHQQPAGHTGPRPSRPRQRHDQQKPPQSKPPNSGQPLPTPRGVTSKGCRPATDEDTEQPPPLPQPRKKAPRTQRV